VPPHKPPYAMFSLSCTEGATFRLQRDCDRVHLFLPCLFIKYTCHSECFRRPSSLWRCWDQADVEATELGPPDRVGEDAQACCHAIYEFSMTGEKYLLPATCLRSLIKCCDKQPCSHGSRKHPHMLPYDRKGIVYFQDKSRQ
jgi:hypothetical protein